MPKPKIPVKHPAETTRHFTGIRSRRFRTKRELVTVPPDQVSPFRPRQPAELEPATRGVIGDDGRLAVWDTDPRPACAVCALFVQFPLLPPPSVVLGTGELIGRKTLVTAAHNLFKPSLGGNASSVRVIPGRKVVRANGSVVHPFGEQTVGPNGFEVSPEYRRSESADHDYGIVFLPGPFLPPGSRLAAAPVRYRSPRDDQVLGQPCFVMGYSKTHPRTREGREIGAALPNELLPVMWSNRDVITGVESHRLSYVIDTDEGTSGAPVLWPQDGDFFLVAIHTQFDGSRNWGIRIHDGLVQLFDDVRQQNED